MLSPPRSTFVASALLLLSAHVTAQVSTASIAIGAPGSAGCQAGTNSPLLTDGSSATGTVDFTLDASTGILTVVVDNTSPVIAASNPLITDIYIDAPVGAVIGASLVSQTGSGGATPAFTFAFDSDNGTAPSLPRAGCFGHFSMQLSAGGLAGGIGNAAASTFAVPAAQVVQGPVTITLQLTLDGVVNASGFTDWMAANPANVATQAGALRFDGAGASNDGSGYVGHEFKCKTTLYTRGFARLGTTFDFCVAGPECCHICLWASLTPGPIFAEGFRIEIGLPIIGVYDLGFIPRETMTCVPIPVPNNPAALGATIYFVNATYLIEHIATTLNVSDGIAVTVVN